MHQYYDDLYGIEEYNGTRKSNLQNQSSITTPNINEDAMALSPIMERAQITICAGTRGKNGTRLSLKSDAKKIKFDILQINMYSNFNADIKFSVYDHLAMALIC